MDIVAGIGTNVWWYQPGRHKAPECFYIEKKLRERMNIPVFHDDQHGTSIIIVGAALLNALQLVNKKLMRSESLHQVQALLQPFMLRFTLRSRRE